MNNQQIKETLEKQLQLLSERSEKSAEDGARENYRKGKGPWRQRELSKRHIWSKGRRYIPLYG